MTNQYDWGIYNGIHGVPWDRKEKDRNTRNQVMYMLDRSLLMFEYHGLPDSIPAIELERLLQSNGFAGVTEVQGELYAFYGGLGGEQDVYGRPTTMVISNPALNYNETLTIDEDVILMRNDSMMLGLIPTFAKYCSLLNENEITMALASISQRVNNLISVADDNTASSADKYLKQLEEGKLGYIFESKLFDSLQTNPMNSAGGGSISDLIELQQYLKASMYNEIGLNANYNMKRERLNSAEVEMNSDNLYPLVDNMLEHRRIALEQINEKYGTEISVEFNSSWDYRINQGEDIDDEYLEQADNQGNGEDLDFSQLLDNPTETEGNGEDNSEDTVEATTEDTQSNEDDEERPQEETEEYVDHSTEFQEIIDGFNKLLK
ncbi:hypothetical protein NGC65_13600 [Staphylococcus xylosus]|uniref:hypothetical protein n=1 Tax=Staphylococcus xylosus TaxID=1288 RepID=UPI002DBECDB6|nr:hypothetical protein [Staphylococcus xylosus]MEB7866458.1 hypothetical protein [Staphylococcus xylosus]